MLTNSSKSLLLTFASYIYIYIFLNLILSWLQYGIYGCIYTLWAPFSFVLHICIYIYMCVMLFEFAKNKKRKEEEEEWWWAEIVDYKRSFNAQCYVSFLLPFIYGWYKYVAPLFVLHDIYIYIYVCVCVCVCVCCCLNFSERKKKKKKKKKKEE